MPSRGTQRPGPPGVCGNTLAMVNAVCDREACFRSRWPMFEKPSATFFAATTPRCKHSGERTRGILRDNDSRFPVTIELRVCLHLRGWRETNLRRNVCHEIKTQLGQQGSSDPCFCVCNFNQQCGASESSTWSRGCEKSAELRMESGFQSAGRWQACGDPPTGSPVRGLASSRAPCANSLLCVLRGLAGADFDNSERQTRANRCVHRVVGFESDFSRPIRSVVDPRQAVGT